MRADHPSPGAGTIEVLKQVTAHKLAAATCNLFKKELFVIRNKVEQEHRTKDTCEKSYNPFPFLLTYHHATP
jgi:hypothetical protein